MRAGTVKKSTEALFVAIKGIGLEVNADGSKYMVRCQEEHAG